ncbi:MAG TPA: NAD-dependent epimerase/dehydratase family protein, partial [Paenibacillus sp.]|nr:NAD-dependent epimerase/dehydratase family protein [Paenibacillus sp.]
MRLPTRPKRAPSPGIPFRPAMLYNELNIGRGWKRMRVFVTGAAGYVGTAIVDALVDRGHEAVCLVRQG